MTSYENADQVIFPAGAATQTSAAEAAKGEWDAVVVGGGMAGSIVAEQLSQAGYKVVILEAGLGKDLDLAEYESYLSRFY